MPEIRRELASAAFAAFVSLVITLGLGITTQLSMAYYEGRLILPFSD